MSILDAIAFFAVMLTLAIIPSTSVALVVARSATLGIANGAAVALGIVLGDLVFILLVLLGLSALAETLGGLFLVIKYIGGAYLIWLGFTLLSSKTNTSITIKKPILKGNLRTSFLSGFFITLGDIKAIFFYGSLFPAFVNLSALQWSDITTIILLTILTVGGVKLAYAFLATKLVSMSQGLKVEKGVRITAGSFMVGAGSYLIVKI